MMSIKTIVFLLMPFLVSITWPSTIGIATGNKTPDGRPLLFKNRDRTDAYPPDVQYYQGSSSLGEYSYVYHKNVNQSHTQVRMGINIAGFGIGNSDSENLSGAGNGPTNSQFLATALKTCASIADFRQLLDNTNGNRDVHAHIGVIDSVGNGSLFEVDGYSYFELTVVDSFATMANTAKFHPSAGPPAVGSTSPQREARATELFLLAPTSGLDYRYFVQEIIQDYCETQAIENQMPIGQYLTNPVLSRYKTAAGAVIRGCKPGDNPLTESVMWLTLGEPSLTVAIPFLPVVDEVFDFIRPISPDLGMAGVSDQVKSSIYDYVNGRYADRYADTYKLVDLRTLTFALQDSLFNDYEQQLLKWRQLPANQLEDSVKVWTFYFHQHAMLSYQEINTYLGTMDSESNVYSPEQIELLPNYPNPFNSFTVIPFQLRESMVLTFQVYDVSGKIVWSENMGKRRAGKHRILFSPHLMSGGMSGGVYFYQLQSGQNSINNKLIYIP